MSVFGALSSAVSGIQAQGTAIGIISDNISNVNTVGYKAGSQVFSTLVTSSGSTVAYSPGGVRAQNRQLIDEQGLVQTTNSPLDIAISGDGFFVVSDDSEGLANNGTIAYTRAGSFRTDSLGNFVNTAGQFLQAWPVDGEGRLPGESGNTTNTTLSSLLESLETVNIGSASGDASDTTLVEIGLNLDASQDVFRGASDRATPGSSNLAVENRGIRSDAILIPNDNLATGDTITATDGNTGTAYTFTYGGFAQSSDINGGTILGADSLTDLFDSGVSNNDAFTITRSGDPSNPVTFTFTTTSSPNTSAGFFNSMATLAEAVDRAAGLVGRVESVGGEARLYLSAEDANEGLSMGTVSGSTANFPGQLGFVAIDANEGFERSVDAVATGIFGSNDVTTAFSGLTDGNTFTLENGSSGGPVSFTYFVDPNTGFQRSTDAASTAILGASDATSLFTGPSDGNTFTLANASSGGPVSFEFYEDPDLGFQRSTDAASTAIFGASDATTVFTGPASGNTFTLENTSSGAPVSFSFYEDPNTGFQRSVDAGSTAILGASDATTVFTATDTDSFTLQNASSGGPVTFSFLASSPDTASGTGQFNNLTTLAEAINNNGNFQASVDTSGGEARLRIASTDPTEAVTLTDGGGTVNFATALGLGSYPAGVPDASSGEFNNITTLAAAINSNANFQASVDTSGGGVRLRVASTDTAETVSLVDGSGAVGFDTALGLTAYPAGAPDASSGEFNSITTLAAAINNNANFQASVDTSDGEVRLRVASANASEALTVADGVGAAGFDTALGLATYPVTAPDTADGVGQFNNITTLAAAINNNANFQATVDTTGGEIRLRVASADTSEAFTITDGVGAAGFDTALGLTDYADVDTTTALAVASSNRWNTLDGLAELVNDRTLGDLGAEIINGNTSTASIEIFNTNPLSQLTFTDSDTDNDVLTELGITSDAIAATYSSGATSANSMSSGNVSPQFERGIRVFDSLGVGHDIRVGFLKTGLNTWFAEIYVLDGDEISTEGTQIAAGEIEFNGDGSLLSIDNTLTDEVTAEWSNNSNPGVMTFDFGTAGTAGSSDPGDTDGLRQFSGPYNVDFINQNGAAVGLLDSVSIDEEGFITANFNNGQTKVLYKIPLADFANPNGLNSLTGNVFTQTFGSGEVNLKEVGDGGVGAISPSSLEGSNSELAGALTDMIVAQRAYQASAKVITTADEMLDELSRI